MGQGYASIFNDVIGPVMTGPSSSHTAGCARIGRMVRLLYGKEIKGADVIFDEMGSYPNTYIGQGSNYGFVGGLLGFCPEDENLKSALEIAKGSGIEIQFKKASLGEKHPNEAQINIYDENKALQMSVLTYSTGGGMFEIAEMDGFSVSIRGEQEKVYISCKDGPACAKIEEMLQKRAKAVFHVQKKNGWCLFEAVPEISIDKTLLDEIRQEEDVLFVRVAEILLPVAIASNAAPVFTNAKEALAFLGDTNKKLWELAISYECSIGKITPMQVLEKMKGILGIMRNSSKIIPKDDFVKTGFLEAQASPMSQNIKLRKIVDTGFLNDSMLWAVAVMENNCAHNIVVAAPTAGSCGVLPASIIAVGEKMGCGDDEMIKALLASGLVGAFIANQATFGAEVAACQAENGAASAMAAAGVVQLLDGSVEESFAAASLALQNLLGLVCDPVGGLTEIPCINRNVAAAANAVMSANMVICGFNPVVPLDETIVSMMKVGKMLPRELRCTCEGGLCDTPTGRCIEKELASKRQVL